MLLRVSQPVLRNGWVCIHPRDCFFQRTGQAQQGGLFPQSPHDLKPDGKAVRGEPAWHGCNGVMREIEYRSKGGERPFDQPMSEHLARGTWRKCRDCGRRCCQYIVDLKKFPHAGAPLSHLYPIPDQVGAAKFPAELKGGAKVRSELFWMFLQKKIIEQVICADAISSQVA